MAHGISSTLAEALYYLSPDYGKRIAANGDATAGIGRALGIEGTPTSAAVAVVTISGDEAVVRATFQGGGGSSRADITVKKSGDGWQVVSISTAGNEVR